MIKLVSAGLLDETTDAPVADPKALGEVLTTIASERRTEKQAVDTASRTSPNDVDYNKKSTMMSSREVEEEVKVDGLSIPVARVGFIERLVVRVELGGISAFSEVCFKGVRSASKLVKLNSDAMLQSKRQWVLQ